MEVLEKELLQMNIGKVLKNEPLSNHTTIKIGGPADLLVEPDTIEHLQQVMSIIRKHNVKWRAIGRGSNLLVSDEGIRGVVVKLGNGLDHLEVNNETVRVGGGYSLIKLTTMLTKQGLSGLEFAGGIPGSVGGAVYMNAGAHGADMSHIVTKAHILFEDGSMEWLTKEELDFSYRHSILQAKRPGVCIEAILDLKQGKREEIVAVLQKNKDYRRETQPWNYPCAGSIFRNPLPQYAGQLIQEAGLKGYAIGGAKISEQHANFIVNAGGATALDVLQLIDHVKKTIKNQFDVEMHTEIEIID
ncbi:UDP-N-acetylmuramate dehydrogenase [Bacillus sp. CGMCC 1.16541]|uniref:UDP-N-acetylmuramate dehydrogenase n=1 Tax=Bacillus sp. CGMCC 1.16541 TaxID=2185143 RepID=UPI000D735BF8|nr:UDP-N-acetylmuramate dehydrogenase [Bacillus sp. CGMCC 1.16541]